MSPHAPGWEVQQAYEMKLEEISDEKKRKAFEERWTNLFAKRANQDFLAVTEQFLERHHQSVEKRTRWFPLRFFCRKKTLSESLEDEDWGRCVGLWRERGGSLLSAFLQARIWAEPPVFPEGFRACSLDPRGGAFPQTESCIGVEETGR